MTANCPRSIVLSMVFLVLFALSTPVQAAEPPSAGLQLWLDASDSATLVRGADGRIAAWRDKSGRCHDAVNHGPASNPRVIAAAMAGRDVLRFDGKQDGLEIAGGIRETLGPLTVFVVSQRLEEQASGQTWQRLLSSNDGTTTPDNRVPNVCLMATVDGVIVRRIKNTDWHDPLHMQFDSETMPTWFGMPKDEDLPSTYSIEYIRAWRQARD